MSLTLTLLHPGAMGAPVAGHAVRAGHWVLWCPDGRGPATARRAEEAGLTAAELPRALAASDVVLSICPPAAAEDVARLVAATGFSGLYVEANAVSPRRLERITAIVRDACPDASVLDAAIIGAPPVGGRRTRLHVAGDPRAASTVAGIFDGTDVRVGILDRPHGAASALKMAFAHHQKISRALAAVSHALADAYGVRDALLEEGRRMPAAVLAEDDHLPSVAARAWRWSPEMREIASTLRAAGLPAGFADAAAEVMRCWDGDKDAFDLSLEETLARLRQPRPPAR
ncbi:NAD(P)-dependent oxidoreductase [Streptomyces capparidis]